MATDMLLDFYESINFELIDIDGYDTLRSSLYFYYISKFD